MTLAPQRLDIAYRIEWQGTWHVGSGFGTARADRLVRRWGGRNGPAFVPGSQLKGVLRHQAERLAATLLPEECPVVPPHANGQDAVQALLEHFLPLDQSPALVDRLFGTRYQGDCLYVDDALPDPVERARASDETSIVPPRLMARTAMDRLTGTVRERHLFVTEISEPGTQPLQGRIRARHPAGVLLPHDGFPLEYALLIAALIGIEGLGGDKSVGQGHCRIVINDEPAMRWSDGDRETTIGVAEALALFKSDEWATYVELLEEERRAR